MRVIVGRLVSSDFTRIAWRAVPAISSSRNNTDLQAEGDDYFMIGRNRWRTKLSLRTHFRNNFRNFEGTDAVVVITDPIQQSRQARRGNLFLLFFLILLSSSDFFMISFPPPFIVEKIWKRSGKFSMTELAQHDPLLLAGRWQMCSYVNALNYSTN